LKKRLIMPEPKILMSNPPWWENKEGWLPWSKWRAGVRAGSRWPFTHLVPSRPDKWVQSDYLPYPMFLGYASTYLQSKTKAKVNFRDSIALRESYKSFLNHISQEKYDFIFIETATPSWKHDQKLIREILIVSPYSKITVCGPICADRAKEILEQNPVHACIQGEYEKGSVRVLNGEEGLIEFDFLTKDEMNNAPFPYYDATLATRYWDALPVGQLYPHAQVWSSRGCPFKCIFCVWPATMTSYDPDGTHPRKVRQYTPEYMEAFLTEIIHKYRFRSIYFDDDTFNLGDEHVLGICNVMSRIGLPWSAMCRVDTVSLSTWQAMHDSGCFGVKIGFESGNQWVVNNIVRKNLNLDRARELVFELKRIGISVHGTFTYGLPGETYEQMEDTKRFVSSLPFDSVQESGTAVIEGTPLSSLVKAKALPGYCGAVIDDGYSTESDGHKKHQLLFGNDAAMARILKK
jgi:radical SAM superfamily enzyme YgiQ (UPF0313 family)